MQPLNPVRAKSYLGAPDLRGLSALIQVQGEGLAQGVEGLNQYNLANRADLLDEKIRSADSSKMTKDDVVKMINGQVHRQDSLDRLKQLQLNIDANAEAKMNADKIAIMRTNSSGSRGNGRVREGIQGGGSGNIAIENTENTTGTMEGLEEKQKQLFLYR